MSRTPRLLVGLGGELAGDDAVGLRLAADLAADPRLPPDVEVVRVGADLLRARAQLAERRHVVLVDAVEALPDDREPLVGDHPLAALARRAAHAHHLDAVQALELMLLAEPELARTRFTWFLVPVGQIIPGAALSGPLEARLPELHDRLLALLASAPEAESSR